MQLKIQVSMWGDKQLSGNHTISTFEDIDRLGSQVASAVRRWCRQVPLRKQGARTQIRLDASWSERERKQKEK